jgi:hypothetical protein
MILRQTMTQRASRVCTHEPGREMPEIMVPMAIEVLHLKKKPLPRINGERKNGKS